jgi:adenylyl cyclase-associated protein
VCPVAAAAPAGGDAGDARSALFADLNKGSDITKGLKKVSDDMKTHKNPGLRQGPQPFKPTISPKPGRSGVSPPKTVMPAKPPRTELDGKKWIVEFHNKNRTIVVDDTNIKQSVYIYKCTESTVQVKGKVNSIILGMYGAASYVPLLYFYFCFSQITARNLLWCLRM